MLRLTIYTNTNTFISGKTHIQLVHTLVHLSRYNTFNSFFVTFPLSVNIICSIKKTNFFTFRSLQTKVIEMTGEPLQYEKRPQSDGKVDAARAMSVSTREVVSICILVNINPGHHKKTTVIRELRALIGYV